MVGGSNPHTTDSETVDQIIRKATPITLAPEAVTRNAEENAGIAGGVCGSGLQRSWYRRVIPL